MMTQTTYVGVDLGGTKIAVTMHDRLTPETRKEMTVFTEAHEGPFKVLERIGNSVEQLCIAAGITLDRLGAVGVGVPAVIDYESGTTLLMPNLPGDWVGLPVSSMLSERLHCPVWLVNDARAFALAEATLGAGKGAETMACFTVGTGIGGGLVIGGKLHMGYKGSAGEFGHQTIDPNGPLCGCGNHGCLEAIASGPAITAAGVKIALQGLDSLLGTLTAHDITRITPAVIRDAAEQGDQAAREILWNAGAALGTGISNVITMFAPERVIVGGGVVALGDWILNPVRAAIRNRVRTIQSDQIAILPAQLGLYSGAIGAAVWAMQQSANLSAN